MTSSIAHECETELRDLWAKEGIEVHITTVPPLTPGPYTSYSMRCPHGVTYWWEPTGEQTAQQVQDGVE